MNLETKITIYKFTPQLFTLTLKFHLFIGQYVRFLYLLAYISNFLLS